MGHAGQKQRPVAFIAAGVLGHAVEGPRYPADLGRSVFGQGGRDVTAAKATGGARERGERPVDAPHHQQGPGAREHGADYQKPDARPGEGGEAVGQAQRHRRARAMGVDEQPVGFDHDACRHAMGRQPAGQRLREWAVRAWTRARVVSITQAGCL